MNQLKISYMKVIQLLSFILITNFVFCQLKVSPKILSPREAGLVHFSMKLNQDFGIKEKKLISLDSMNIIFIGAKPKNTSRVQLDSPISFSSDSEEFLYVLNWDYVDRVWNWKKLNTNKKELDKFWEAEYIAINDEVYRIRLEEKGGQYLYYKDEIIGDNFEISTIPILVEKKNSAKVVQDPLYKVENAYIKFSYEIVGKYVSKIMVRQFDQKSFKPNEKKDEFIVSLKTKVLHDEIQFTKLDTNIICFYFLNQEDKNAVKIINAANLKAIEIEFSKENISKIGGLHFYSENGIKMHVLGLEKSGNYSSSIFSMDYGNKNFSELFNSILPLDLMTQDYFGSQESRESENNYTDSQKNLIKKEILENEYIRQFSYVDSIGDIYLINFNATKNDNPMSKYQWIYGDFIVSKIKNDEIIWDQYVRKGFLPYFADYNDDPNYLIVPNKETLILKVFDYQQFYTSDGDYISCKKYDIKNSEVNYNIFIMLNKESGEFTRFVFQFDPKSLMEE